METEVKGLCAEINEMKTGVHDLTAAVEKNGKGATFPVLGQDVPARYVVALMVVLIWTAADVVKDAIAKDKMDELTALVQVGMGRAAKAERSEILNGQPRGNANP